MYTVFISGALTLFSFLVISPILSAAQFTEKLCQTESYKCYKVKKGETWESLFPDAEHRQFVKKINRMNIQIRSGMIIAIPKDTDIEPAEFLHYSPFLTQVPASGEELIKIDLSDFAWAAYDPDGTLVKWGPISGGKSNSTITGTFIFYRKQGSECVSSKYPIPKGGAPMPYCMHFRGGYAVHGSPVVPGYHASHGCVRIFTDDAQWLNRDFVDTGSTKVQITK